MNSTENTNQDDLYEHFRVIVDPGQTPIRIDKYLMEKLEKVSRTRVQKAAKENYVFVNEIPVNPNYKVQPNDEIVISFPFERRVGELLPEDIPLDIIFEDEHVMVINKAVGMVVHPGVGNWTGTLVNALAFHLQDHTLPVKPENSPDRPGIVHRIDKDTSGLMIVAKTQLAMTELSRQFFQHTIDREYLALVWGNFEERSGTITGHIARHEKVRYQMMVVPDSSKGKHAITHYRVEEDLYYVSLVRCKLETGRTHQIRVHMKYAGHPLFGDWRYQGDRIWKGTVYSKYKQFVDNCLKLMPRQALHAHRIGFVHPVSQRKMTFEQPLPEDFTAVMDKWRKYVKSKATWEEE